MVNWIDTILELLGGLTVFLYAMAKLAGTLKETAGERLKRLLARMTTNAFAGLLSGCAITAILDSSSVTIILVIALVHAGALTFEQSLAVILGSNIGTTVSSQVYAIELDRFSPILLLAGLALAALYRNKPKQQYGYAVFFLGLLLFGLHLLGEAAKPLREQGTIEAWLRGLEDPIRGAAAGAVGTGIIQSSSAMMGIVIKLASAGLLSLQAGVAVMLGAEIGTCLDTFVASIGRSREALRAGVFHMLFNIVTVVLGLVFYEQIAAMAQWLPGDSVSRQIANAHVFFNIAGALLFLPLIPICAAALKFLVWPEMAVYSGKQPEPA